MQSIAVALQIYALAFIISFFIAVLIKAIMFSIRRFSRDASEKPQDAN